MSYSDFRKTATECDLELATLLAALWGVSKTQIELWTTTMNGGN